MNQTQTQSDAASIDPKVLETMKSFAESYAKTTNTFFCIDSEVTESVIIGLGKNKELFGAPLCPCRFYDDKVEEITLSYWNCPCVPMRERKECHCMLFLKPENEFAAKQQEIHFKTIIVEKKSFVPEDKTQTSLIQQPVRISWFRKIFNIILNITNFLFTKIRIRKSKL